jgi:tetratricopeptide (TPR) repeat protein
MAQAAAPARAPAVRTREDTIRVLRAELEKARDPLRQARLHADLADAQEHLGDDASAARHYLAALEADSTFREPLEGLAHLIDKHPSLRGLANVFDELVRQAAAPDERVRALLMRAAYRLDIAGDLVGATANAREATAVDGAPTAERASAWLMLEILAGRSGDAATRKHALAERTKFAADPTWRALLLIDRARLAAVAGEIDSALALLEEARATESQAVWAATTWLEQILRDHPGIAGTSQERGRAEQHARTLEAMAGLIRAALVDVQWGAALGVPNWVREPGRAVDAWLRAAEAHRVLGNLTASGGALNGALPLVDRMEGDDRRVAEAAVSRARIRLAEQTGDTALAAQLAARQLDTETDGAIAAALALRVAEQAAAEGDSKAAIEALNRAIASDPGCLPARALRLDVLADGRDWAALAIELESFAAHLTTDEARGRAWLLAAWVCGTRARDGSGAKAALGRAAALGVGADVVGRTARLLAGVREDWGWYEEATEQLLASAGAAGAAMSLGVELVRLRQARGDGAGAARAAQELARAPGGAWLARVLEAFSPPSATDPAPADERKARARRAVEELTQQEPEGPWAAAMAVIAAMRSHSRGDLPGARRLLRHALERGGGDVIVGTYLADLDRAAGDHASAARVASLAAASTRDPELAASLHLEAAFEMWRTGQRGPAVSEMERGAVHGPEAAGLALGWASWAVDPDSPDARRRAIVGAQEARGDESFLALERFACAIASGDSDAAASALQAADAAPGTASGSAAALARLVWRGAATDVERLRDSLDRIAALGPEATLLAEAERVRVARESDDAEAVARAARAWFQAGGGLKAALEWMAASLIVGDAPDEMQARLAIAAASPGEGREAMLASAALLRTRIELDKPAPLVVGQSPAARLANLELAPPGCDPRRRAAVLDEVDGVLGDEATLDAAALSAWARLLASDIDGARATFERVAKARPDDLIAWEGLRTCAQRTGDQTLHAHAAAQLGALCQDPARGSAFWEEAALVWLELADDENADHALEASFARDPRRPVAFDTLFRRLRDRKDHAKLLPLIDGRLVATHDKDEILKLYWEQARARRALGDPQGALKALDHVTMLDPHHLGALALLGEINIRRGHFEEAATALAQLAMLDSAPAKSRVTAAVAAVDLYENKLERFDRSLGVLLSVHKAKISTLPVRERLARAAARTGSWRDATTILEELMLERPDAPGRIEAARLAIAIHRDRIKDLQGAASAIVKLLGEAPSDAEGLEMLRLTDHPIEIRGQLLTNARSALLELVREQPADVALIHRMAAVARDLSDDALEQATLGALSALGAGDAQTEQLFAQLASRNRRMPQVAISEALMRVLRAPGDEGPIADLFALLGPTLAEALGPNLSACGVGRRDKVDPRSGLALRNEIASWAGAFGLGEFDLYVGGKDALGVQGIAGERAALVVGPGINAPLSPTARARVARELFALVRGTTVVRWRDELAIAAIVVAACRIAEVPIEHPPYSVLAEIERLIGKAIPRRTRKLLPNVCRAIATHDADVRGWNRRALASHDRVAAIASGDPSVVLDDVLGGSVDRVQSGGVAGRAQELLGFVLSQDYLDARRALGLEGGS